jgi:hypothetical protein
MEIDLEKLKKTWSALYPGADPRAEELKSLFRSKWLRIYTLDHGKRYADNAEETTTIINRHNAVIKKLNHDVQLILMSCEWSDEPAPSHNPLNDNSPYWRTFKDEPKDTGADNVIYRHIYVGGVEPDTKRLNDVLEKVANDEIAGIIIAPLDLEWVYHPYDGGGDIILSNRTSYSKEDLKKFFFQWIGEA